MKGKTSKRLATLYKTAFRMAPPYKFMADGNFLYKCIQSQVSIQNKLDKYIGGAVHIVVTNCVLEELRSLGSKAKQAYELAQTFRKEKCAHSETLSPDLCIQSHVGQKNKGSFFVGTQDYGLKRWLADVGRVGVFTFFENKLGMERPSRRTHEIMECVLFSIDDPNA